MKLRLLHNGGWTMVPGITGGAEESESRSRRETGDTFEDKRRKEGKGVKRLFRGVCGECQEGVFSDQYREMHNDTYYHRECYARRVANLRVAQAPSAVAQPQKTPDAHARSEELRQSPRAAAPVSEEPVESSGGAPNAHAPVPGRSETAGRQGIQLDQGESAVLHAQVKLQRALQESQRLVERQQANLLLQVDALQDDVQRERQRREMAEEELERMKEERDRAILKSSTASPGEVPRSSQYPIIKRERDDARAELEEQRQALHRAEAEADQMRAQRDEIASTLRASEMRREAFEQESRKHSERYEESEKECSLLRQALETARGLQNEVIEARQAQEKAEAALEQVRQTAHVKIERLTTEGKEELDHVKRQLKEAEQQNLQLAHDKARLDKDKERLDEELKARMSATDSLQRQLDTLTAELGFISAGRDEALESLCAERDKAHQAADQTLEILNRERDQALHSAHTSRQLMQQTVVLSKHLCSDLAHMQAELGEMTVEFADRSVAERHLMSNYDVLVEMLEEITPQLLNRTREINLARSQAQYLVRQDEAEMKMLRENLEDVEFKLRHPSSSHAGLKGGPIEKGAGEPVDAKHSADMHRIQTCEGVFVSAQNTSAGVFVPVRLGHKSETNRREVGTQVVDRRVEVLVKRLRSSHDDVKRFRQGSEVVPKGTLVENSSPINDASQDALQTHLDLLFPLQQKIATLQQENVSLGAQLTHAQNALILSESKQIQPASQDQSFHAAHAKAGALVLGVLGELMDRDKTSTPEQVQVGETEQMSDLVRMLQLAEEANAKLSLEQKGLREEKQALVGQIDVLREKDELTGEVLERLQVELEALQDEFMQKQAMHEAEAAALHHKLNQAESTTHESHHGQDQLTAEALEHLQADLDALGALMLGISETYSTQTAQMKCQHAKDEAEKEQLNRQLESERNVSAALQVELAEFGKVPLADVVQSLQLLEDTSMTLLQEAEAAALHHKLNQAESTTHESHHGQDQLTAEALEHLQADLDALGALMLGISETYSTQTAQMKCQHAKDEAEKEQLNRQLESERNVSAALQVELAEFGKVPLADVVQSLQLLEDTSMTLLQEFDQVQQEMQKIPKQQQHGAEMDKLREAQHECSELRADLRSAQQQLDAVKSKLEPVTCCMQDLERAADALKEDVAHALEAHAAQTTNAAREISGLQNELQIAREASRQAEDSRSEQRDEAFSAETTQEQTKTPTAQEQIDTPIQMRQAIDKISPLEDIELQRMQAVLVAKENQVSELVAQLQDFQTCYQSDVAALESKLLGAEEALRSMKTRSLPVESSMTQDPEYSRKEDEAARATSTLFDAIGDAFSFSVLAPDISKLPQLALGSGNVKSTLSGAVEEPEMPAAAATKAVMDNLHMLTLTLERDFEDWRDDDSNTLAKIVSESSGLPQANVKILGSQRGSVIAYAVILTSDWSSVYSKVEAAICDQAGPLTEIGVVGSAELPPCAIGANEEMERLREELASTTKRLKSAEESFQPQVIERYKESIAENQRLLQRLEAADQSTQDTLMWKRRALEAQQRQGQIEELYLALRDEWNALKSSAASNTEHLHRLVDLARLPVSSPNTEKHAKGMHRSATAVDADEGTSKPTSGELADRELPVPPAAAGAADNNEVATSCDDAFFSALKDNGFAVAIPESEGHGEGAAHGSSPERLSRSKKLLSDMPSMDLPSDPTRGETAQGTAESHGPNIGHSSLPPSPPGVSPRHSVHSGRRDFVSDLDFLSMSGLV